MMYVYVLIILFSNILELRVYTTESVSPNVGTVLFTKSDLVRKRWNINKIRLLQARKHLQLLIPPPDLIDTVNEEYLNNLLMYYKEAYRTVKREIKPGLNNIMNTALSDALGGYLKVWVLPITKYAYYGGTVSMEKAINMFHVFEDIKRNLRTDGSNWRNPNENLLKLVAIDVISRPRVAPTRSMKDPCKHLAYYEKTDTDLAIPLPVINWDILPITIFVPLKNQSLIPISSTNSSKILLNYYDIAENCMQAQSPTSSDEFKQKFQTWLSKDVAPHLNDDNLYIAFGSVLSLMNDTRKSCGSFTKACSDKYQKFKSKTLSLGSTLQESSKKCVIIVIIFLVEIIWCLPSIFYILHVRRKKRNRSIKSYFCRYFRRKPHSDRRKFPFYTENNKTKDKCYFDMLPENKKERGVKLSFKPRVKTLEVDVQYPSCDSKYLSIKSSKSCNRSISSNQMSSTNKFVNQQTKPSLNKILPEFDSTRTLHSNNVLHESNSNQDKNKVTKSSNSSKGRDLNLEPTRTLTLIQDEKTIKEINYSQESVLKGTQSDLFLLQCKCCNIDEKTLKKSSRKCSCSFCFNKQVTITENKDKPILPKVKPKFRSPFGKIKTNEKNQLHKTVMNTSVEENAQTDEQMTPNNKVKPVYKILRGKNDTPLLRIRIERPQTEIKVGITSLKAKNKPSKIPRLTIQKELKEKHGLNITDSYSNQHSEKLSVDRTILRKENLKQKTLDDSVIQRTGMEMKHTVMDRKLNATL